MLRKDILIHPREQIPNLIKHFRFQRLICERHNKHTHLYNVHCNAISFLLHFIEYQSQQASIQALCDCNAHANGRAEQTYTI